MRFVVISIVWLTASPAVAASVAPVVSPPPPPLQRASYFEVILDLQASQMPPTEKLATQAYTLPSLLHVTLLLTYATILTRALPRTRSRRHPLRAASAMSRIR